MAKRFTDTDKWKKKFIRGLTAPYKVLWLYILDECDHAGIWHVEIEVAKARTGCVFDESVALEKFHGHIEIIDGGDKWFIPDFIDFQYGQLNPANKVHKSVLDKMERYKIKPLARGLEGAKDKDKDMDMDKEEEEKKTVISEAFSDDFSEDGKGESIVIAYRIFKGMKDGLKRDDRVTYNTTTVAEWVKPIRELLKHYTKDQILDVINWAAKDEFWRDKISGTEFIKRNFDKIKNQYVKSRATA